MLFHLAIPSRNLFESTEFYTKLGAHVGRTYDEHVVLEFFGIQLVCHRSSLHDQEPKMYPRHFGVILESEKKIMELWERWQHASFVFEPYFIRNVGKREEHHTFFLVDSSNNIIEFKWYRHRGVIFGS